MLRNLALTLALIAVSATAGTITQVASPIGFNDAVTWGVEADDLSFYASPYTRTSTGGLGVIASGPAGFVIAVQGNAFVSNFTPGSVVLTTLTEAFDPADGPIILDFDSAIRGIGFNIAHQNFGAFTGTMEFFGAGNVSFGTVTQDGTASAANDGTAIYLAGTSSARDITRVVISVNTVLGNQALAISTADLLTTAAPGGDIPEPATVSLFAAAGIAAFAFRSRRK